MWFYGEITYCFTIIIQILLYFEFWNNILEFVSAVMILSENVKPHWRNSQKHPHQTQLIRYEHVFHMSDAIALEPTMKSVF